MDRISLIKLLIAKRGYKRYLEIGCFADECFKQIDIEYKVGVDPVSGGTVRKTSDDYFAEAIPAGERFDIVFIDGLHHHAQVYRDVLNALECLNPGGAILLHDCLPPDAYHETDPKSGGVQFCGTCWRALAKFREREDLDAITGDFDYGVGLIRRVPNPLPIKIPKTMDEMTYADFVANRSAWMRPQDPFVFELLADRPWGTIRVAMLVIGKNDEEIAWFKEKSPGIESEARIVHVANPNRMFGGTAAIANPFIDAATEDVVAIVHADTTFAPGAITEFAKAAIEQNSLTGIVGRTKPVNGDLGYRWCNAGAASVSTLDSCSVFFRRSSGLRFDGVTFGDFHCVVEDLCLQGRKLGMRAIVPHAEASHIGMATEPTWSNDFWKYRAKLLAKYPGAEIHTV